MRDVGGCAREPHIICFLPPPLPPSSLTSTDSFYCHCLHPAPVCRIPSIISFFLPSLPPPPFSHPVFVAICRRRLNLGFAYPSSHPIPFHPFPYSTFFHLDNSSHHVDYWLLRIGSQRLASLLTHIDYRAPGPGDPRTGDCPSHQAKETSSHHLYLIFLGFQCRTPLSSEIPHGRGPPTSVHRDRSSPSEGGQGSR